MSRAEHHEPVVPDALLARLLQELRSDPHQRGATVQLVQADQIVYGAILEGAVHCFATPRTVKLRVGTFAELIVAAKVKPEDLTPDQRVALLRELQRKRSDVPWGPAEA